MIFLKIAAVRQHSIVFVDNFIMLHFSYRSKSFFNISFLSNLKNSGNYEWYIVVYGGGGKEKNGCYYEKTSQLLSHLYFIMTDVLYYYTTIIYNINGVSVIESFATLVSYSKMMVMISTIHYNNILLFRTPFLLYQLL